MLTSPPVPVGMDYLHRIASALYGRSGVGDGGVNPLSPVVARAYLEGTHTLLRPHEFASLFEIDAAMVAPGDPFKKDGQ